MTKARRYDVVLYGATGYTGGLVAEYLAQVAVRENLRWALAGRCRDKLEYVRQNLPFKEAQAIPDLILADSHDQASMLHLVQQTKVVISTVGPYRLLGEPLVRACAESGTHYVDLTGEPNFVRDIRSKYHDLAVTKRACLVPSCGFESIPPDMGVLYTLQQLRQQLGEDRFDHASIEILGGVEAGGKFSGGTWASALHAMAEGMSPHLRHAPDHVHRLSSRPRYLAELRRWAIPLPTIDGDVVRQSARCRHDYGTTFSYGHFLLGRKLLPMLAGAAGVVGIVAMAQIKPARQWMMKRLPQGEGPTAQQRSQGWFRLHFLAEADGLHLRTMVSGGDPGYGETAKMLSEAALTLARHEGVQGAYGVLTPAAALGEAMIGRLQRAGIAFNLMS